MRIGNFVITVFIITLLSGACSKQDRLYQAIRDGNAQQVAQLIAQGADVNKPVSSHTYPLLAACRRGQTDMAALLLQAGANVNAKDDMDRTALIYAVREDAPDLVRLLLSYGVNTDAVEVVGKGPYEGKPVKVMAGSGWSALMYAVYYSEADIVKDLLNAGANVNLTTANGNTALKLAQKIGNKETGMAFRQSFVRESSAGGVEAYQQRQREQVAQQIQANQEIIRLLKAAGAKE